MAADHADRRIRCNAIAPGIVPTPLVFATFQARDPDVPLDDGRYEAMLDVIGARQPLGRLGAVEEIASLATFLMSDESSWMTGQILSIDGGQTAIRSSGRE